MSQGKVRICPNPNCRLVTDPDPRIYKNADERCPRCGTKWSQKRPGQADRDDQEF